MNIRKHLRKILKEQVELSDTVYFETAQGSKYIRTPDGKTRRWKSSHANTGGEDMGLHDWYDNSIFVDPKYEYEANSPLHLNDKGIIYTITDTSGGAKVIMVLDNGTWRPGTWKDAYPTFVKLNPDKKDKILAFKYLNKPTMGYNIVEFELKPNKVIKRYHFGSPVSFVRMMKEEDKNLFGI